MAILGEKYLVYFKDKWFDAGLTDGWNDYELDDKYGGFPVIRRKDLFLGLVQLEDLREIRFRRIISHNYQIEDLGEYSYKMCEFLIDSFWKQVEVTEEMIATKEFLTECIDNNLGILRYRTSDGLHETKYSLKKYLELCPINNELTMDVILNQAIIKNEYVYPRKSSSGKYKALDQSLNRVLNQYTPILTYDIFRTIYSFYKNNQFNPFGDVVRQWFLRCNQEQLADYVKREAFRVYKADILKEHGALFPQEYISQAKASLAKLRVRDTEAEEVKNCIDRGWLSEVDSFLKNNNRKRVFQQLTIDDALKFAKLGSIRMLDFVMKYNPETNVLLLIKCSLENQHWEVAIHLIDKYSGVTIRCLLDFIADTKRNNYASDLHTQTVVKYYEKAVEQRIAASTCEFES